MTVPTAQTDALEERLRSALAPRLVVVGPIGAGGMARVFLAREPALKRFVAVKLLSADLAANEEARQRFEREAQSVAQLSHPNIVAIYSVGELPAPDGTPYFVMQHVAGRSMAARVEAEGPLPVPEARRALAEVAAALAEAHKHGIIHRDIKPANILYEESTGRSLVSDFGIAGVAPTAAAPSPRLTSTGMVVGTPMYMSPEQLLAETVSDKTDVYSLGLLAHELLTGSGPFRGSSPHELIAAVLRDTPPPLAERRPEVDDELSQVVARCLDKDATKRPTAEEVAQRLAPGGASLLEWPPPGLEPLRGQARRLSTLAWLGSALTLAGVLPLVASGGTGESTTYSGAAMPVIAFVAGVGILLAGMLRGARLGAAMSRGVRAGYAWTTILETFVDRRGDTGHVIAGSREYAALAPPARDALRRTRIACELGLLVAGVLPVPLLLLVIVFGDARLAGPGVIWIAVMLPLLAGIAALARDVMVHRQFQERRHRRVAAARAEVPALSAAWNSSFESLRQDQTLGRGAAESPWAARAIALALAAVTSMVALLMLPLVLVGAAGPIVWGTGMPKFTSVRNRLQIASVVRPFVLAKDSSIAPLEAGQAYYALLGPQDPSPLPENPQPERERVARPWADSLPPNLFAAARPKQHPGLPDNQKIILAVAHGFTPAETAFLAKVAHWPLWRDVDVVARAKAFDYEGARFRLPFPDTLGLVYVPVPRYEPLKTIAYAGASRAAYYLARGRRDSAEAAVRQIISFGLAMADQGNDLLQQLTGIVISGIGRQAMIDLYKATHDPHAALLQARVDSAVSAGDVRIEDERASITSPTATRAQMERTAADRFEVRGWRASMLIGLGMTPCADAHELVFGPDPDVRAVFDGARRTWARFPSDSALLELMYTGPERLVYVVPPKGPLARLIMAFARLDGALLRNRRIAGCTAVLLANAM